jgi:hypothetical protein
MEADATLTIRLGPEAHEELDRLAAGTGCELPPTRATAIMKLSFHVCSSHRSPFKLVYCSLLPHQLSNWMRQVNAAQVGSSTSTALARA